MGDLDHVTEIERVLRGQTTGRDATVTESWRRGVETYGMDPSRPVPAISSPTPSCASTAKRPSG